MTSGVLSANCAKRRTGESEEFKNRFARGEMPEMMFGGKNLLRPCITLKTFLSLFFSIALLLRRKVNKLMAKLSNLNA